MLGKLYTTVTMVFTQSKDHNERGDYSAAKEYANIALGFTIAKIAYVLGVGVISIGLSLGIYYPTVYS